MLFESLDSLKNSLHIITALATPLHIFGAYCILFKTPKTMKPVKWVLLNLHIWSMVLDYGFSVLVVPLLILPAIAGYTLGLLTNWFGVPSVYQLYLVLSSVFAVSVSIIFIFENRFYQLYAKNSAWRYFRIPCISLNYILCFTFLVPACLTIPDQNMAFVHVFNQVPNMLDEVRNGPIFVFAIEYRYALVPYVTMVTLLFFESVASISLIYWNMSLNSRKVTQSGNTVKLQKKFLQAIFAQATVFIVNILAPILYLLLDFYGLL